MRITQHDRLQVELNCSYPKGDAASEELSARVEIWLFLPHAVGVDENDYSREDFYQDLRAYTRLSTPKLTLEALSDPQNPHSPLHQLDAYATALGSSKPKKATRKAIRRECRLLGSIFRQATRTPLDTLRATIQDLDAKGTSENAQVFAKQIRAILKNYRRLAEQYKDRPLGKRTSRCLGFTDEYLSLQAEEGLCAAIAELDTALTKDDEHDSVSFKISLTQGRKALVKLVQNEQAYRAERGWRTALGPEKEELSDANYIDQSGLLKKYIASALFLRLEHSRKQAWAEHAALGIAAALAMVWAVGVQLAAFFLLGLELDQSMSAGLMGAFAVIAVAAYILKDRIKASVASALKKKLPNWLPDRTQEISYPESDTAFGSISERMEFIDQEHVPPEVIETRLATARSHLVAESQPDILYYQRDIQISSRAARAEFPRFEGVKDVLRLNVWRWLRTLASHRKHIMWLDTEGALQQRKLPHQYVVDLLIRYTLSSGDNDPKSVIGKARIWMDRRGLLRVQLVDG